jgi:hypothetical protein
MIRIEEFDLGDMILTQHTFHKFYTKHSHEVRPLWWLIKSVKLN